MAKNRSFFTVIASLLVIAGCNLPGGTNPQATPTNDPVQEAVAGTMTALASSSFGEVTPTFTGIAPQTTELVAFTPTSCNPSVTANVNANVRSGPGTVYPQVGALLLGQTATVAGKNAESTWWYIVYPAASGGHGWIAGSTVTSSCIPASVAIIAAPPTPLPASGTCRDGFVHRLINSSDKTCVPPASKAQADADNAAAASRKLVTVYGAGACKDGFVWREAYSGDKVCVTPATRSQAQADNAAAASRVDPGGAYGPNSCIVGYVWREATAGDVVCVTPDVRTQTAADNAAASSRVAGADDCISGYVWREAFSGDRICVTPAVKSQVAADNAAALSRTWP
ncbi:MAG: SH3 domain-containing protein [Anaerolineales bacterium]|nr:MAG: SH3 domain-containing protein [Anaerolineales bacterium]